MRPKISDKIKQEVIRLWLLGHPRDDIVHRTNTSGGSVKNIVDEWKERLDSGEADALRELGKSIHASGFSPSKYAAGVRITNILEKNGVNADKAEQFLAATYKKCESAGITPDRVLSHIEDLMGFSDGIRLPEIDLHIKQKTSEKEEIDRQIREQQEKISNLKSEVEELEKRKDRIVKEQRKAGADFRLFVEAKQELERLNVPISDVPNFASAVKALAQFGYRPDWIKAKIEEMFHFDQKREWFKAISYEVEKRYNKLNVQNFALQQQINLYSDKLPIYKALENHGVGHRELLTLLETILNISTYNGIDHKLAVDKLFADIQTQYNPKLGFESEIEGLNFDIEVLTKVRDGMLEEA